MRNKLIIILALFLSLFIGGVWATTLDSRAITIRSIAFDGNGRMWLASFGKGLWLADGSGTRQFFDASAVRPFPMINNLLLSNDRLYVATAGGGCVRLNLASLQFDPLNQTPGFEKLHALMQTASGEVLIGSVGSGTALLRDNTWEPVSKSESSQLAWVNSIVEWRGSLWLATATGLYESKSISPWKPQATELRRAVNCLLVHNDVLYAGTTDRGVYAIKPGSYPEQLIGTIGPIHFLTRYDDQIITGGEMGLWSIRNNEAVEIEADIFDAKCAAVDAKKILYLGTMSGKIFTSDDARKFIHTMSLTENGLEEHKQ